METDASDFVTAAILSQYDDSGKLRPVAFMSEKMLPAECNYEIFDKELLALVNAFQTWTTELGPVEASTLVLTDHKSLEYFTTTKKLNRRQVRWNQLLADFDFKILFRPGKLRGKPDALTRINADKPSSDNDARNSQQFQTLLKPSQILRRLEINQLRHPNSVEVEQLTPSIAPLIEEWEQQCDQDKYCQEIRSALKHPNAKHTDIQLASCALIQHSFSLNDKEYLPRALREDILKQLYNSRLYGHRGAAAICGMLSRCYWWPECPKDSSKYARGCQACQRNNPATQKPHGFLQPLPVPQASFRHLTLDFIGHLPICQVRGFTYRFILQIVDRLTKRVWIIPLERPSAYDTAEAFLGQFIRFAGLPDSPTPIKAAPSLTRLGN
ncbi:hypothetical protein K3495_g12247 [Podosphaera aphanis]|nr:hypothetical protein K3495_g12247 [Podosphaera aphanis]